MSQPTTSKEAAAAAINRCVHELGEHFESVQILATRLDGETTMRSFRGVGNWYARQGMAHEFLNEDTAQEAAKQIAQHLMPPD